MILQQKISTIRIIEEIEKGLDFILSHFSQDRLFPRKIQTSKSEGKQVEVFSKEETLKYFKESGFVDCRINAFPSYTEYKGTQRYPPDLIFIDIDRSNFKDDKSFENALSKTLKNIKMKLNGFPTVNWSGNGYHILQPIECPILEQIEQFQKYQDKDKGFFVSQEFLRFAKNDLSNNKADPHNHPSFKSCQIRVPGSINSKCLDNRDKRLSGSIKVKTIQKWNGIRDPISREFIEDFRTYLEQKVTDLENNNYNYNYKNNQKNHYNSNNNSHIDWIEKLLKTPVEDCRKEAVELILIPYLVKIKALHDNKVRQIIKEWLQKCETLRKLDRSWYVDKRINQALRNAHSKQYGPMSKQKIKTNYSNLYFLLANNEKTKEYF